MEISYTSRCRVTQPRSKLILQNSLWEDKQHCSNGLQSYVERGQIDAKAGADSFLNHTLLNRDLGNNEKIDKPVCQSRHIVLFTHNNDG